MPTQIAAKRLAQALTVILGLCPGGLIHSIYGAETAERYVTLRDGSLLRINLGGAPPLVWDKSFPPVSPADLDHATFALKPAGAVIREIRNLVAALASMRFAERQAASVRLLKIAPGFESLLTELKDGSEDPEVKQRLASILNKRPSLPTAAAGFDLLVNSKGERFTGDVADWSATVLYRADKLELSRKNVARISKDLPDSKGISPVFGGGGLTRNAFSELREDLDEALPPDLYRTDFETDPKGVPLKIGDDISRRFTSVGFQISTSVPGAIVSVNDFAVQGRSRGLSAATHDPLWEGTLTVRFHAPGKPSVPSFVSAAGFWVASVSPNGTALEAYDGTGNLAGTVKTKKSGNEFLAFSSPVPIGEIRIVPNVPVDPNYTIDDLFFTRPTGLGVTPEAGWGVVHTCSGERFLARNTDPAEGEFLLKNLSYGADSIRLDSAEIVGFAPSRTGRPPDSDPVPPDLHWVMLDDGTRLRATRADFPEHRWATFSSFPIPEKRIVALWGLSQSPKPPPESYHAFLRARKGAVTPAPTTPGRWIDFEGATLGKSWIDAPDSLGKPPVYRDSAVVWFGIPPKPNALKGRLTLSSGEQIPLSAPDSPERKFWVRKISNESVDLSVLGNEITIPWSKVVSCHFPEP